MQTFTSEDLQRRPADVQQSALAEPTFITVHGRPRLVIMSLDEFDRLRGRRHRILEAVTLPDEITDDLRRMAEQYPKDGPDLVLKGGLLEHTPGTNGPPPR